MRQSNFEKARLLAENDLAFLYDVYDFRCISTQQAFDYYYADYFYNYEAFYQNKIQAFIQADLIEVVLYKEGEAVFLTNNAIEIVRDCFGLATNILDKDKNVIRRGYYRASELKMLPRLITHQVHLNRFVLDFRELAKGENLNWKHYGEKNISQYFGIRPDAMLRFYELDIFLEQDMASESKVQLTDKWNHYRTYLRSRKSDGNLRKIIMLFIVDNTNNPQARKELVRYTAIESLLDQFGSKFDIYVGTRDELLDLLFTSVIPTQQAMNGLHSHYMQIMNNRYQFVVQDAQRLRPFLSNTEYTFYQYKMSEEGTLLIENGKLQEFLLDDATGAPFSMMQKIAFHKRNSSAFYRDMNRHISTIFLLDNEQQIRSHLQMANLMGTDDVYYTTLERLERLSFPEALFQFDRAGQKYHFANSGLVKRVYEETNT